MVCLLFSRQIVNFFPYGESATASDTILPMDAIEVEGVTKTFGSVKAVDDLTLAVPQGAVYGFIGPNGSGKTTTMRMIVNIIYPDSGTIRVFGEEPRGGTGRIGYLPEE